MRAHRLLAAFCIALPLAARSQGAAPAQGEPSVVRPFRLVFLPPPSLAPGGSLARTRRTADEVAREAVARANEAGQRRIAAQW